MRGKYRSISLSQNVLANTKFATSPAEWDASVFWTTSLKFTKLAQEFVGIQVMYILCVGGGEGEQRYCERKVS